MLRDDDDDDSFFRQLKTHSSCSLFGVADTFWVYFHALVWVVASRKSNVMTTSVSGGSVSRKSLIVTKISQKYVHCTTSPEYGKSINHRLTASELIICNLIDGIRRQK